MADGGGGGRGGRGGGSGAASEAETMCPCESRIALTNWYTHTDLNCVEAEHHLSGQLPFVKEIWAIPPLFATNTVTISQVLVRFFRASSRDEIQRRKIQRKGEVSKDSHKPVSNVDASIAMVRFASDSR